MKRLLLTAASLAVLSGFAFAGEVKWETNFNKALKSAAKSKRLIFIDFYADW